MDMSSSVINFEHYYKKLELTKEASLEEIKTAYRRLARRYHPDLNPRNEEAEERFKEINTAHEILCKHYGHRQRRSVNRTARKFNNNRTCDHFAYAIFGYTLYENCG